MGVFGDTLRQARAHKGVTLREAEQATRISRHYLLALEEEHFDQLPALIYQRGIVKNYAAFLDLDQAKLLKLYQAASGDTEPAGPTLIGPGQYVEPAGGIVPNFAVIGFVVVMMAVIFAWGYSAYVASPADLSLTQSPPTVTTVSEDDRFIPSPTATATPKPKKDEKKAKATAAAEEQREDAAEAEEDSGIVLASVTATSEPVEVTMGGDGGSGDEADEEPAGEELSGDESAGGARSYSFYTTAEVTLTVVVDNVLIWDGQLGADKETPYMDGEEFLVTFSGADVLYAIDGEGNRQEITDSTVNLP